MNAPTAGLPAAVAGKTLFGQPRGLATLFLTEMWERFTYYGMRAVLILFMVEAVSKGGLGIDDRTANNAYGLYVGSTYLFSLLGGWIADRLVGGQRAVAGGALLVIAGNLLLAFGNTQLFFVGLLVIAVGIGLIKPNCSAMVASLYPEGGARRDAGFSFFYMGINLGALIGPVLVGLAAAWFGYRAGVVVIAVLLAAVAVAAASGALQLNAVTLAAGASWAMGALALVYFAYLLFFAGLSGIERRRAWVMVALFTASVIFWAGYEQTGASFNLFAERYTDRHIFGWDMPAGWLQSVDPLFVIAFAPLFAWLWIALGKRGVDPNAAAKFGLALILLGLGFMVMYLAARHVLRGELVLPTWLVLTYLLHTFAELCLSPVGLSNFSKLAPARFVGQIMGVWFLSLALGSNLAGQLSGTYDPSHLESLPGLFLKIF